MKITVGIVTYNRLKLTKNCLESYLANSPRCDCSLMIVDNNSTDGTRKYLGWLHSNKLVDKLVLNKKNLFLGGAFNQILHSPLPKSEWVIVCANDSYFVPGWYDNFLRVVYDLDRYYLYSKARIYDYYRYPNRKFKTTESGGSYMTMGWEREVGAGFSIKTSFLKGVQFAERPTKQYASIRQKIKNLKFEDPICLRKPCILEQDCEFDNPNFKEYYLKTFQQKGKKKSFKSRLSNWGFYYSRDSKEYKEYFDEKF